MRSLYRPTNPEIFTSLIAFFKQRNQSVENRTELVQRLMEIPAADLVTGFPLIRFQPLPLPKIEAPNAQFPFIQGSPGYFAFEENFNFSLNILSGYNSNEAIAISSTPALESFRDNFYVDIPSIHFNLNYTSETYQAAARLIE